MVSDKDIQAAVEQLSAGNLVAFPTETVYGLGADALNALAVAKIFELKKRPSFDPLIVHIHSLEQINELVVNLDTRVEKLATAFWPGPLTIIMEKSSIIPDIVTAGLSTVGIRMPSNPVAIQLLKAFNKPIAAPSANMFGKVSPTKAEHVTNKLEGVEMVLDGGPVSVGIESTIVQLLDDGFKILRPGFITYEDISSVIPASSDLSKDEVIAPGMVKSHYSPDVYLKLIDSIDEVTQSDAVNAAIIPFKSESGLDKFKIVKRLSANDDLKQYAVNIFSALHELQDENIDAIYVEKIPEEGLGLAIMDRLKKAAYRFTIE